MSSVDASPSMNRHEISYPVDHMDRLSILPDSVLSHILSCMPIIDAVRTCVLSKYWEFKWTTITKLRMVDGEFPTGRDYGLSRVAMLISALLRRNIRCRRLGFTVCEDFVLPRSLLDCSSLRELYLDFWTQCSLKVPANNRFPNLKTLSLKGVMFLNEISDTDTHVFSFPVLKILKLEKCKWVKVKFVSIYAPSLRTFMSYTSYHEDDNIDCAIKVHGAKITELNTYGGHPENMLVIGSIVEVFNLECFGFVTTLSHEEYRLRIRKLLREHSYLKQLCVMEVLEAIGRTKKLGLPVPRFCHLKVMHLAYNIDGDGLLELLHASPFLENLELVMGEDEYEYDSVEDLPSCVVHHLEELTIYYYERFKPNYLVEKFLLKNGTQIKKLTTGTLDEFPENEMLEKLSMFPRASPCLKIASIPSAVRLRMGYLSHEPLIW